MKALVTYQSKTGFTEKYAAWISQALSCDVKKLSEVTASDIESHDLIIHGGWIMGGMINGLDQISLLKPKKLMVFGVGFTPKEQMEIQKCIDANKLGNTPFYYCEGGMDPKKMGFVARAIVRLVTKKKPEYTDLTNRSEIEELVKAALSYVSK